jgi:uncharacterized protein YqgQ
VKLLLRNGACYCIEYLVYISLNMNNTVISEMFQVPMFSKKEFISQDLILKQLAASSDRQNFPGYWRNKQKSFRDIMTVCLNAHRNAPECVNLLVLSEGRHHFENLLLYTRIILKLSYGERLGVRRLYSSDSE